METAYYENLTERLKLCKEVYERFPYASDLQKVTVEYVAGFLGSRSTQHKQECLNSAKAYSMIMQLSKQHGVDAKMIAQSLSEEFNTVITPNAVIRIKTAIWTKMREAIRYVALHGYSDIEKA